MSFDVYLHWFEHGECAGVPEQVVRDAFGDGLDTEDEFGWHLKYGDDERSDVYVTTDEAGLVTGLSVNRPCRAPALWDALFELLGMQVAAFYFPPGCLVMRKPDDVTHLPDSMVEAMGPPIPAEQASDLLRAIEEA